MKTWLASYADSAFHTALNTLMTSAARCGIDERRPWGRAALEQTSLYKLHKSVLDMPRGAGYWLWKPFIIRETLKEMAYGDLLVYSDAGIEIMGDLSPLFEICRERNSMLLFSGHYEEMGAGGNLCAKWTKRDCFVYLDFDEPRYHQGRLVDASFIVLTKTGWSLALVHEWLLCCGQPHLLTDEGNLCGLPDLPGFIEHRHDEAILSLLAVREGLELFRHPCQHVIHLKDALPDAETADRRGVREIYGNSPYPMLLHHHRGLLNHRDLTIDLRRSLPAPRERVFEVWTKPGVLKCRSSSGETVVTVDADVRVGGQHEITLTRAAGQVVRFSGVFLDVEPPGRLVCMGEEKTRITVEFSDCGGATGVALKHEHIRSKQFRDRGARAWTDFLDVVAAELGG